MQDDAPPLTIAEEVLKYSAPELARHVHAFLHGGHAAVDFGRLPLPHDWQEAMIRMRRIHDCLSEAMIQRRDVYKVSVLATALRLQGVIVYEIVKRTYSNVSH